MTGCACLAILSTWKKIAIEGQLDLELFLMTIATSAISKGLCANQHAIKTCNLAYKCSPRDTLFKTLEYADRCD